MRLLLCVVLAAACHPQPAGNVHVAAASRFTLHYRESNLSAWGIRAQAAGADCDVLVVETAIVLDDSLVEALHYGGGRYDVYGGGVQFFYRQHSFRAVAYKDVAGRFWVYGDLNRPEIGSLAPCS